MALTVLDKDPTLDRFLMQWMQQNQQKRAIETQRREQEAQLLAQQFMAMHPDEQRLNMSRLSPEVRRYVLDRTGYAQREPTAREQFDQKVATDALTTFDTLPQSARQQGTYQMGYGAAMPQDTVKMTNAQNVYGNKGAFAPEMQMRQLTEDKLIPTGQEAWTNENVTIPTTRAGLQKTGAEIGKIGAETTKLGAETTKLGAETEKTDAETGRITAEAGALAAGGAPSNYQGERRNRIIKSIDGLLGNVNRLTTGIGSVSSSIPETPARNFKAAMDTLKANIAFNELNEMRAASRTGGALGQVSDKELGLLESALGALDQGQSPDTLKSSLQQIKESVVRWESAKKTLGASPAGKTVSIGQLQRLAAKEGKNVNDLVKEAVAEGFKVTQ